jgi:hypothetical protein
VKLVKAAKAGTAERSPHAKAEYSIAEFEAISQKWVAAMRCKALLHIIRGQTF